jgi:hypothetical protein
MGPVSRAGPYVGALRQAARDSGIPASGKHRDRYCAGTLQVGVKLEFVTELTPMMPESQSVNTRMTIASRCRT